MAKKNKLISLIKELPDLLCRAEDHNEDCISCNGNGITYKKVDLYTPCTNCKATGRVPFVDNMIPKNNPPDFEVLREVAERNLHVLTSYIREEYARLGIEISIRIDFPHPNRGGIAREWEKRNFPNYLDFYPKDGNIEEKLIFEAPPRRKL